MATLALLTVGVPPAQAAPPTLSASDGGTSEMCELCLGAGFSVNLSRASRRTVTVKFATADGTARAPGDYQPVSGTLSFAPGETVKRVFVQIRLDGEKEPAETFFVNLSMPTGGAAIGDGQGVGTILAS